MSYVRHAAICIAAAATLGLAASAAAQSAPGITEDKILIGGVMGLSGPVRLTSEPYENGARAFLGSVNEAGGVNGRMIEWIIENDDYQPSRAVAAAKKLVQRDGVFMIFGQFGTAPGFAIASYLEQAKVPMLMATNGPTPMTKYTFGGLETFTTSMELLATYLIENQKDAKIGVFFQNDDYGQAGRLGIQAALEKSGGNLVADVGFERNATNYSNQLIKLRDSGADVVIAMVAGPTLAQAVKTADALGYKPTWAASSIASTQVVMDPLGDRKDGIIYISELNSPFSKDPGVEQLRADLDKYTPGAKPDWGTMLGYAHAQLLVHVLNEMGDDLTRDGLVEAFERTSGVEVATMAPLGFTPTDHNAANAARIFQWENGEAVTKSDWMPLGAGAQ